MGNSPSIRDIARYAGVSPSTVSRILNSRGSHATFTEETRERIMRACAQLNYQPNVHAQRLFSQRTNVLAFTAYQGKERSPEWPRVTAPLSFSQSLAGVQDQAERFEQDLLLVTSSAKFFDQKRYLSLYRSRSIDGMVVWGGLSKHRYVAELVDAGYPVVQLSTRIADDDVPYVIANEYAGSAELAKHLLELGHRRLAYFAGPPLASVALSRRDGFVTTCQEAGARVIVVNGAYSYASGYALTEQLFSGDQRPTAVAAANDAMAVGVIEALAGMGLRVPQDVSVVGADNVVPLYAPRLTTMHEPSYEMGCRAVEFLIESLEGKTDWASFKAAGRHLFNVEIKIGQTTAPPPGCCT